MGRDLNIIIVNYNSRQDLEKCLDSINRARDNYSLRIIVIDNQSTDGSNEYIEKKFPNIMLIRNKANLGFSRACNQGLEFSQGKYVLFLNPDTVLKENDGLGRCMEFLDLHPNVGLLGCRLENMDGSLQPSCNDFPYLHKILIDHILRKRIFPERIRGKMLVKYWIHNEIREVDWVLGAFMLSKVDLLKGLGGFNEDFFLYGEDMDLCYRIKKIGRKVVFFPETEIIHVGNPFWDKKRLIQVYNANILFSKKHFPGYKAKLLSVGKRAKLIVRKKTNFRNLN